MGRCEQRFEEDVYRSEDAGGHALKESVDDVQTRTVVQVHLQVTPVSLIKWWRQ